LIQRPTCMGRGNAQAGDFTRSYFRARLQKKVVKVGP
jgi:hypothetical protein